MEFPAPVGHNAHGAPANFQDVIQLFLPKGSACF